MGKLLEARSKGRTTDALKGLMKLAPQPATVLRDGIEQTVPVAQVQRDDIFVVRPGESVPVDGTVLEGSSAVNESALTGESVPVDKAPGDLLSAATVNQSGFLKARATRVGEDTTLSQIIKMVSDAAATKAPIAKAADKISGIFVPAVLGVAVVVTVIWLLVGRDFSYALGRGISVLVISCPCALGLATPVAIMVGNGVGAKNGILFKTAVSLEQAGKAKIVALDKTGTITTGQKSEHPLAKAIVSCAAGDGEKRDNIIGGAYAPTGLTLPQITDFRALPGHGLEALLEGKALIGGSVKYVAERLRIGGSGAFDGLQDPGALPACHSERSEDSVPSCSPQAASQQSAAGETGPLTPLRCAQDGRTEGVSASLAAKADELAAQGKTPLLFAYDGRLLGLIAVADVIKPESPAAVKETTNEPQRPSPLRRGWTRSSPGSCPRARRR